MRSRRAYRLQRIKRIVVIPLTLIPSYHHTLEKVEFAVVITNANNLPIQILEVNAVILSNPMKALDEIGPSSKFVEIPPLNSISLRFVKLLCETGEQTVRVSVRYNNSLANFTKVQDYSFLSVKPFDLAFSRFQLSENNYVINSTLTNRLPTEMIITKIYLQVPTKAIEVTYNSFSEPAHVKPGAKYSHLCIVEAVPQEGVSLGALGIHFITKGHKEIGLNSSMVTIPHVSDISIHGYYEISETMTCFQPQVVVAVLINMSNEIQLVSLDWSTMNGAIQVIGECRFNKLIQPGKTLRIKLQVVPLVSGFQILEAPRLKGKEETSSKAMQFSPISILVQ